MFIVHSIMRYTLPIRNWHIISSIEVSTRTTWYTLPIRNWHKYTNALLVFTPNAAFKIYITYKELTLLLLSFEPLQYQSLNVAELYITYKELTRNLISYLINYFEIYITYKELTQLLTFQYVLDLLKDIHYL